MAGSESGSTLMSKSDTFHEAGGFRTPASEPRAPATLYHHAPQEEGRDTTRMGRHAGQQEEEEEERGDEGGGGVRGEGRDE